MVCIHPREARADEETKRVLAEGLFQEGLALSASGNVEAACTKFSESARLDTAPGTLLNLAQCYEKLKRLASAWTRYRELESVASARGQTDRTEYARAKVIELGTKLSYLTIRVTHPENGLVVSRDDVVIGRSGWSTAIPVDPGSHVLQAEAPGYIPWTSTFTIEKRETSIQVPALLPAAKKALPEASSSLMKPIGVSLTIAGGVLAAGSLSLGGAALLTNNAARKNDCTRVECSELGSRKISNAIAYGNVATALGVGAAVLAVTGVILWVSAPKKVPNASLGVLTF
jgi:hypothetical protein